MRFHFSEDAAYVRSRQQGRRSRFWVLHMCFLSPFFQARTWWWTPLSTIMEKRLASSCPWWKKTTLTALTSTICCSARTAPAPGRSTSWWRSTRGRWQTPSGTSRPAQAETGWRRSSLSAPSGPMSIRYANHPANQKMRLVFCRQDTFIWWGHRDAKIYSWWSTLSFVAHG